MSPPKPKLDPRLEALAKRIEALVKASPYKPAELSRLVEVDRSSVSKWMSGERTPTMKNLYDLAEALGIEMTEIWDGPESMPATPEQKLVNDRMRGMSPVQQQAVLALLDATMGIHDKGE